MESETLGFTHVFEPGSGTRTLLLLHGTGGDERDLLGLGRALDPDAARLSPLGKVREAGMPRFFRRLAEGVFDEEDLVSRAAELAGFVRAAAGTYGFAADRVVAAGFSNGANIGAALLLLHPGLLQAAALFAPMVPLVPAELPDLHGVPVFLSAGRVDPIVGPDQTERLAALLTEAGAETTLAWHPGGHSLGPDQVREARAWLAEREG